MQAEPRNDAGDVGCVCTFIIKLKILYKLSLGIIVII